MIRLVVTGVWICLVTALSSYAATLWRSHSTPGTEAHKLLTGLETMQTGMLSVPVVAEGAIQGYVLAQFNFAVESEVLKRMSVTPDVFLADAAFRSIYAADAEAMRGAKKQDLAALTTAIAGQVNQRFGDGFVKDVLIEKFAFVPKSEIRDGANLMKGQPNFSR